MSFLDSLFPCSFKGIPFLVRDMETAFGSKTVDHEYPNSDIRYIENLGGSPRVFKITGFVVGEFYQNRRDALLQALEDGDPGLLQHPTYGNQTVVAKPGTVTETITEAGIAKFDMTFSVTGEQVNPSLSDSLVSQILDAADALDNFLQASMALSFSVSKIYPLNFRSASNLLGSLSASFDIFQNFIGNDSLSQDLNNQQTIYTRSIPANINNPTNLAGSTSTIFAIANNQSNNALLTGNAFITLFDFNNNFQPFNIIGRQRQERALNNLIITYIYACYALFYAYLNFSQATFSDSNQLAAVERQLEAQYLKIINGNVIFAQPVHVTSILSYDSLFSLQSLRNLARKQFDQDSVNVSKVVSINIPPLSSLSLVSYQFYGATDEAQTLKSLNDIIDFSFASGTIDAIANKNGTFA